MTLQYRIDEQGGFVVGNVETGRASYAQPDSKNAVEAKQDPEKMAQRMNAHQADGPSPGRAEREAEAKHWERLTEGGKDGSTREVETRPTIARMTDADNVAPRQPAGERQPLEPPTRVASDYKPQPAPTGGPRQQPSTPGPGGTGAFGTPAQVYRPRGPDGGGPPDGPPPTPAAPAAAKARAERPPVPKPDVLKRMEETDSPAASAKMAEVLASKAGALLRAREREDGRTR